MSFLELSALSEWLPVEHMNSGLWGKVSGSLRINLFHTWGAMHGDSKAKSICSPLAGASSSLSVSLSLSLYQEQVNVRRKSSPLPAARMQILLKATEHLKENTWVKWCLKPFLKNNLNKDVASRGSDSNCFITKRSSLVSVLSLILHIRSRKFLLKSCLIS